MYPSTYTGGTCMTTELAEEAMGRKLPRVLYNMPKKMMPGGNLCYMSSEDQERLQRMHKREMEAHMSKIYKSNAPKQTNCCCGTEPQGNSNSMYEENCAGENPAAIISPRLNKYNRPSCAPMNNCCSEEINSKPWRYENPLKNCGAGCGKSDGGFQERVKEYDKYRRQFTTVSIREKCRKEIQMLGGPLGTEYKHAYKYPVPSCYQTNTYSIGKRPPWNRSTRPKTPPVYKPTIGHLEARLKELETLMEMDSDEEIRDMNLGLEESRRVEDLLLQSKMNKHMYATQLEKEVFDKGREVKEESPWPKLLPPSCEKHIRGPNLPKNPFARKKWKS